MAPKPLCVDVFCGLGGWAQIANIPFELARWIAQVYKPVVRAEVSA
jgi:hypothetical protein